MQQELTSPIVEIGLADAEFRGALVLSNGFERVAQLLLEISEQMMKSRLILWRAVWTGKQGSNSCSCMFILTDFRVRGRQFIGIFEVNRIQSGSALKVGKRFRDP